MHRKGIYVLFGIGLVLVILAVGSHGQIALGDDQQPPCTITVAPGQSIQAAINKAGPWDVICLEPGEWEENLVIGKSITIRGAGMGKSVIRGKVEYRPVLLIENDSKIEVTIENLTITGTKESTGIQIDGKAQATIRASQVSESDFGLWLMDWVQATISGSTFSEDDFGIVMDALSQVTISGSTFSEDNFGISMSKFTQATISGSTFTGNEDNTGIIISNSAQATISGSTFTGDKAGIIIINSAQVTISSSSFTGNDEGIVIGNSAQATISGSNFFGNQTAIGMLDSTRAVISGSTISGNVFGIGMDDSAQAEIRGNQFHDNRYTAISVSSEKATVSGGQNEMRGNGADLIGYAPAFLRQPLVPQTASKTLSVPGDYPSIQEAIDAIAPGGTITVAPGTYEEGLTIWKPLTLRGAGIDKTVLKPISIPTRKLIVSITAEAKGVVLAGLSITGSEENGIDITGEASLKELRVTENGSNGIWMWGASQAAIAGSTFTGNSYGIGMGDSSQATISGSKFSGNSEYGIVMNGSAQAEIQGNRFLNNGYSAIFVSSKKATARGGRNEMHGNGVDLAGYAPASLRQPLVPQTASKTLSVPGDYPSIQEAIDAIAPGGTITVAPGTYEAELTIWKPLTLQGAGKDKTVIKPLPNHLCRVIVSITSEAKGVTLAGLSVTGSNGDGLFIYGKASLNGMQLSDNDENGIELGGSAQVTISESQISENGNDGIFMGSFFQRSVSQAQATISSSQISGNGEIGILMMGSSQATISDSQISENSYAGIVMADSSQAKILKNRIFDNTRYGVALYQRPCFDTEFTGKVEGSANEIHKNAKGDVCPAELKFLMTGEGGCYGKPCE